MTDAMTANGMCVFCDTGVCHACGCCQCGGCECLAECCKCGAVEVPAYAGALNDEGLADCVCSDCLDRLERRHWDGED